MGDAGGTDLVTVVVTDDDLMCAAESAQAAQDAGNEWGYALGRYYARLGVDG